MPVLALVFSLPLLVLLLLSFCFISRVSLTGSAVLVSAVQVSQHASQEASLLPLHLWAPLPAPETTLWVSV